MPQDPFFDFYQHQLTLPDHVLRDLARNECAGEDYRKHAVEILRNRKSPLALHEDLKYFMDILDAELEGIQFEFPAPSEVVTAPVEDSVGGGPLSSSITTKTMFGDPEVIDNQPVQLTVQLTDEPAPAPRSKKKAKDATS